MIKRGDPYYCSSSDNNSSSSLNLHTKGDPDGKFSNNETKFMLSLAIRDEFNYETINDASNPGAKTSKEEECSLEFD